MSIRIRTLVSIILLTLATWQLEESRLAPIEAQLAMNTVRTIPERTVEPAGIYGADDALEREIFSRIDRFAEAGLVLPDIRIYFHDSREGCRGHMGLYGKGGDQHRIDLCELYPEVVTHELAHAWEYHKLDDATREAYLRRADLSNWNDKDSPHPSRGVERVAYLISWGLEERPIQKINRRHYAEKLELYEFLTGRPSPRIAHLEAGPATFASTVDRSVVGRINVPVDSNPR